ncbi:hypothetical protein [Stenotrophomonas oahuensis]|uniref:Uncharacterized protein n=1 Tax=Stenotrophomonas oahuensis TaxID=3003271 RepID=A0ABY9YTN2_9GAMM|nr:hypothetical protein [Stenotrophomonas sp. A5586]WNH54227.1 hypothetical protein PDM29_08115 [Stenotrophomonas sp. A5586]
MHKHWSDTHHAGPIRDEVEDAYTEQEQAAHPQYVCDACNDDNEPFMTFRGYWIYDMNMPAGAGLEVVTLDDGFWVRPVRPCGPVARHMPRIIKRVVQYTEVETNRQRKGGVGSVR